MIEGRLWYLSRYNMVVGADGFTLLGNVEDGFEVSMNNWSVMCRFLYSLCLL